MAFDAAQLITRIRRDDPEAIGALLRNYRNYLRVLAQMWLPADLPTKLDGSDPVQETLLRAYQRFDQFQGTNESQLTAWLRPWNRTCRLPSGAN